jgi:hypothetical protein
VDVAEQAGLHYRWTVAGKRPLNILQTIGNGCALLDYNNDDNLDILLVGARLALFQGNGKGKFRDVSAETGLDKLRGHFLGCAVADYDNDGWRDLYISGYRTGLLLKNNASKRFQDVTQAMGLKPQPWGTSCGFADLDNDGWLDLYVANYADFGPDTKPQLCNFQTADGPIASSCGPTYYKGIQGVLYHNQKGRAFRDVTRAWGADAHTGRGLGVAFADFDGSGRVGFAIANDEAAGNLFQNKDGGRLKEIGVASGTAYDHNGMVHGGMGIDWGDYDNDGRMDLFVATFRNEAKSLYRNEGDSLFTDVSYPAGLGQPALPYVAFGAKFADFDNDGWLDLLIANGHVQDNIKQIENTDYPQPTQLFRNKGGAMTDVGTTFEDVSHSAGPDLLRAIVGRGLAVGDFDNDGRIDALIVDSEGKPLLLHNQSSDGMSGAPGAWVGFRLSQNGAGGAGNRDAYGAVVTVRRVKENGDGTANKKEENWVRQCQTGGSYLSSSDPRVHFGLGRGGAAGLPVQVSVRWPDGKTETWDNVPTGRYLLLERGKRPA